VLNMLGLVVVALVFGSAVWTAATIYQSRPSATSLSSGRDHHRPPQQ
jgi:hypothetical protein